MKKADFLMLNNSKIDLGYTEVGEKNQNEKKFVQYIYLKMWLILYTKKNLYKLNVKELKIFLSHLTLLRYGQD